MSGHEEEAVSLIDNRDFSSSAPNNKLLLVCEHAVNDLKGTQTDFIE